MKKRCLLIASAFFLAPYGAKADMAQTVGATLQRGDGARPSALGKAYASIADDIHAMTFNPANMARTPGSECTATYSRGFIDESIGFLGYNQALPFGALYAGGIYLDGGDIDLNLESGLQETRKAQEDIVVMLGAGFGRKTPISVGGTVKGFRFELAEEASASGFAFDGGAYWKPARGLALGAAVQNLGSDIEFEVESESLPLTVRYGGSYQYNHGSLSPMKEPPFHVLLAVDGVSVKDEDTSLHAGLEIQKNIPGDPALKHASVRGGYISESQTVTVGAGIQIESWVFDYGISLFDELDNLHRFTLTYQFNPLEE